jgi:hypothetical protein
MTETKLHRHGNSYHELFEADPAQPAYFTQNVASKKVYNYLFTLAFLCREPIILLSFIGASLLQKIRILGYSSRRNFWIAHPRISDERIAKYASIQENPITCQAKLLTRSRVEKVRYNKQTVGSFVESGFVEQERLKNVKSLAVSMVDSEKRRIEQEVRAVKHAQQVLQTCAVPA